MSPDNLPSGGAASSHKDLPKKHRKTSPGVTDVGLGSTSKPLLAFPTKASQDVVSETLVSASAVSAMILVSVGIENFNKDGTRALLQYARSIPGMSSITFAVADTLQRYNLAATVEGATPESKKDEAAAAGSAWITAAQSIDEELSKEYVARQIYFKATDAPETLYVRWDAWLEPGKYAEAAKKVEELKRENPTRFENAMQSSVDEYASRRERKQKKAVAVSPTPAEIETFKKNCYDYLIEEITAMFLWPETKGISNCNFIIYPGEITEIMRLVLEKIHETHSGLQWIAVDFDRRDQKYIDEKLGLKPNPAVTTMQHVLDPHCVEALRKKLTELEPAAKVKKRRNPNELFTHGGLHESSEERSSGRKSRSGSVSAGSGSETTTSSKEEIAELKVKLVAAEQKVDALARAVELLLSPKITPDISSGHAAGEATLMQAPEMRQ